MLAEVAVPVHVRQTFTYNLPAEFTERAQVGCRVLVPLGKKVLTGFIVALKDEPEEAQDAIEAEGAPAYQPQPAPEIKDVQELLDDSPVIGPDILDLTRWMADYYFAPWGECLRAALPAGAALSTSQVITLTEAGRGALMELRSGGARSSSQQTLLLMAERGQISMRSLETHTSKPRARALVRQLEREGLVQVSDRLNQSAFKPKLQNVVRLFGAEATRSREGEGETLQSPGVADAFTEPQRRVIELLTSAADAVPLSELLERANVTSSVVRTLEKRGALEVLTREVRRDPLAHIKQETASLITLNDEQQAALERIVDRLNERKYSAFLLHGVTGSGKTEIYIRSMLEAVRRGRTALMLVPEISLTPILSRRLRSQFGGAVAILHSSLSEGERTDEWRRIKEGEACVVIGTRSAVFAPLENLGLIVVDEEHETSYKQDESPRYNGRDTAIMRAARAGAVVVLGSATPSLESFHNAHTGKSTYIKLLRRYGDRPLAQVQMVDMREVFKRHGKQQVFSDELKEAIAETHARGEQMIILLNRRGFSAFALCRSCGESIRCPNCDVTLTYHRYNQSLLCHYCNYVRPAPRQCPTCEGVYIHYVGEGTEQLEARLRELFPKFNIARVDRDTTRRRGSFEAIAMEFEAGTIDLLVGTQMLAKGHDFPNVTLVGVISVDVGLSLPDFRAAERTFQLLTQVAGRSGRGQRPGRVIIQTYHPAHYALVCAQGQDYEGFYRREVSFRRSMHYPPFTALINILVHDKELERTSAAAAELARELREATRDSTSSLRVLGPAPAPIGRIKNEYRFQVLIKAVNRKRAREALDAAMERVMAKRSGSDEKQRKYNLRMFSVEVDPLSLM